MKFFRQLLHLLISATAGLVVFLISVVAAGLVAIWFWKLYPDGRAEIPPPAGTDHVAFTHSYGFGDWLVGLYVRDFPSTFSGARFLLQIDGEDAEGGDVRWTKDGTMLLVTEGVWTEDEVPEVKMAYDYEDHRLVPRDKVGKSELDKLVAERGGAGPAVPYRDRWIDEDEDEGFTGSMIAPLLFLLMGLIGGADVAWKLFRNPRIVNSSALLLLTYLITGVVVGWRLLSGKQANKNPSAR